MLGRIGPRPRLRAIPAGSEPSFRILLVRLLAQDTAPQVPVAEMIDERLAERRGDGYRYADMPEDWEAWPRSIVGLDAMSRAEQGRPFHDLDRHAQIDQLERLADGSGDLDGLPMQRVFSLWTRYACDAFYSHPWAWNEIGFGGPAYPRGYKNLGLDHREGWERTERDARDPIPWVQRVEAARRRHAGASG